MEIVNAVGLAVGLLLVNSGASVVRDVPPRDEIVLCGGLVPDALANANATFTVVYGLALDSSGSVQKVTRMRNPVIPDGPIIACLRRWSLPARNVTATVAMTWRHARGWTDVAVTIPGFPSRRITIDPGCSR